MRYVGVASQLLAGDGDPGRVKQISRAQGPRLQQSYFFLFPDRSASFCSSCRFARAK